MVPLTATSAGDAVLDLRVEPTIELRIVEAPEAVPLERGIQRRGLLFAARWQLVAKRAMDVVGSLLLLLVLSPLLLLTAAAVFLTSRGPVLYVQDRIGRNGDPFRMLKFRSMRADAHEDRHQVTHLNEAQGPVFKVRRDPRITAVGRVVRKLSVDELPQLFNVLRGEMSLVGPRPPLPEEWAEYGPRERKRLAVAPGITCIWQVSGRSDLDFDTWVDMDLAYISEWNLRLDVRLLFLTIPAVVSGRGAY
jgi:lipopolysaccharide/colanic/teichoic acid biosynthesis glycosyltransferase